MEEMGETNSTRVGYEKVRDFSMEDWRVETASKICVVLGV
jgi:hypothetical protein